MFLPFGMFYDPTFIFVLIGLAISGIASSYVQSTFNKYSKVNNQLDYTASEVARVVLNQAGLSDVAIEQVRGNLTDHYDPKNKVLRLSDSTAQSRSVAAIGVAAHEAGHAMQDRDGYLLMRLRTALVPITNFGQSLAFPILLLGMFFGPNQTMINIGLVLFSFAFIFQMVTLPVEFNASNRAMKTLESEHLLNAQELPMAGNVLKAAAFTYVAGAIASFLNVLRLFLLFGGNSRRD